MPPVPKILVYHSISQSAVPRPAGIDLAPELFEAHLAALAGGVGGGVRPLSELVAGAPGVGISFDDGYRDNLLEALPRLTRWRLPATFFVATDMIGKAWESPQGPMPGLTEAELRELAASGLVEIGSHGASHQDLTRLGEAAAAADLARSRARLAEILGRPPRYVAYPFGAVDAGVERAAKTAGFEAGFAVFTRAPGPFSRLRIPVGHVDGVWRLRLKLACYFAIKRLGW